MTVKTKSQIKDLFMSGDRPSQADFGDLVDSYANFGATGTPLYPDLGVNPNVYAITATGVSAYVSGQNYSVLWGNTNTSAATLNVNGLGATAIRYANNSGLTGNELPQNGIGTVYYNGTTNTFQLPNITPANTGGITSLTGDVTATGPGAAAATLASTAVSAGTYANPTIIVDAKGRITSATAGVVSTSGLVKIASAAASNSTTIDFVNGTGGVVLDGTYRVYLVAISNVAPATDATNLYFRTSTNGGSSYDSGAGNYDYINVLDNSNNGTPGGSNSNSATQIIMTPTAGSDVGESLNGMVYVYNPSGVHRTLINWQLAGVNQNGNSFYSNGTGSRLAAADVDAIRFLMSSGNISSGTFQLYGYN